MSFSVTGSAFTLRASSRRTAGLGCNVTPALAGLFRVGGDFRGERSRESSLAHFGQDSAQPLGAGATLDAIAKGDPRVHQMQELGANVFAVSDSPSKSLYSI